MLEEKKRNEAKVTWDGHTSSMAATAKKAQDMITPEDLKPYVELDLILFFGGMFVQDLSD